MKKRTRRWSIAVLAGILAVMLCACSSSGEEKKEGKEKETKEETKEEKKSQGPSIEEQVLYEENGFRITAKELKFDEDEEYGNSKASLSLFMENEGKEDLDYVITALTVNHYEMGNSISGMNVNVPSGKKANENLNIYGKELEKAGFDLYEIGEIEVDFRIGKTEDETSDYVRTGLLSIKTTDYDKVEGKPAEDGKEIFNEAGVRIAYLGMSEAEEENIGEFSADVFIENTSDKPVICWIFGGTIDGKEVSVYNTPHVSAGRMAHASIEFFGDDVADIDMESIGEITVTINLTEDEQTMDEDGWASRKDITEYRDVTFSVK